MNLEQEIFNTLDKELLDFRIRMSTQTGLSNICK